MKVSKKEILTVRDRLSKYVQKTPIITNDYINTICNANVYFKCENYQTTSSFKFRAATNALLNLSSIQSKNGVITHSSGNFAQALACSTKMQQIKSHIVMPKNAPEFKKKAVLKYTKNLVECESTIEARKKTSLRIKKIFDLTFIHPSNNANVILGNSTVVSEMLNEQNDLNYIFCPIGGGGLIAGSALSANVLSENCEIIGVEPFEVDDAYRSINSGKIEFNTSTNTIADGLRTNLGDINFPVIIKSIKKIIRVSEKEIIFAMKLIYNEMKILIEPSSAVTLAGLLKTKNFYKKNKIGIIISGGNVDKNKLPF